MDMNTIHNCDTCRHHLGGGCCRINLEAECGKGEFEAWEPKADTREGLEIGVYVKGIDLFRETVQRITEALTEFGKALAKLKEADPDLFNWNASGPIRRVQLRRARALMEGKRHGL